MSVAVKYFDTYEFVKKSKELGSSEQLAEYQVKQIEKAIEIAVAKVQEDIENRELSTKKDVENSANVLRKEISEAKNQIILWVAGLFVASGLLQHFFK